MMPLYGDNPFDDGLDFAGCPPPAADLILPKFPERLDQECQLICWARCLMTPDGIRPMRATIEGFERTERCGVYRGTVLFVDLKTHQPWYKGELLFYYTRNYEEGGYAGDKERERAGITFRFVAKGDLYRVADDMPEWECLILCTKPSRRVESFREIFVYGGLDLVCDVEQNELLGFRFHLGHNDGWYTHHPECSARKIPWQGRGDYIGHYCDRGWLFVSPGRNFVFSPRLPPPTGRFCEEALREIGDDCFAEEAIRYGSLARRHAQCIHAYQQLRGVTECETSFHSVEPCYGLVYTGQRFPWLTFFSMGYWFDRYQRERQTLHLVEGAIRVRKPKYEEYERGLYFYGFATQSPGEQRKLVDLASNKDLIGAPADSYLLLYLYNAGPQVRNPKLRYPISIDHRLARELSRQDLLARKERDDCAFLDSNKDQ